MKKEIKSYFKAPIKAENGKPSIVEIDYTGADGVTYKGLQFEGYASTKDPDRCNDIVLPEAFNDSIKGYMENPVILLQHDHEYPIGSITEATIDMNGLYVKGIVKVDTENVFQALRTGVIKTMSFGYRVNDYECETKADNEGNMQTYNIIKQLELFEISLVSVPMNPKAQVKNVEELKGLSDEEYSKYFQINKKDEYSLYKSISDALSKYKDINVKENETVEQEKEPETIETPLEENNEAVVTETNETKPEVEVETQEEVKEEVTIEEKVEDKEVFEEEKAKKEPMEGDPCTCDDGSEGIMTNTDGVMACKPKKPKKDIVDGEIVEEKVQVEEPKETIETPENTENVVGNDDTPEKVEVTTTENVETDSKISEVVEKVENIEKTMVSFVEKSQSSQKGIDEIFNTTNKNTQDITNISKSIEVLEKSNKELQESNQSLKSENEKLTTALIELAGITGELKKAFQRITLDGAYSYREEPKVKENPVLNTDFAKKLKSIIK